MRGGNTFFIHGNVIDGKSLAHHLLDQTKVDIETLPLKPCLAVILVGDNPASEVYVRHKQRTCERVGIESRLIRFQAHTSQEKLLLQIHTLNEDKSVHGILLQMPLPSSLKWYEALQAIHPLKDVDGLHHENLGLLFSRKARFIPCTPKGCLEILRCLTPLKGKRATVVGRSILVGRPMAALLLRHHATVTIAHRYTEDLASVTRDADILVVAAGKPGLMTKAHVKPGAIVLDVGITRVFVEGQGKLVGDVAFDEVAPYCSAITPVPGGVGPLTVACLMQNVVKAARLSLNNVSF